jgi:uncharacterized protein YdhG (YjbR/CyaY superfamily)
MAMKKYVSVADYFDDLNETQKKALIKLRELIISVAKDAEETISYGMPAYFYHGQLVFYGAFKNHYSFFPGGIVEQYKEQLKDFKISKGTLQIGYKQEAPLGIIEQIIRDRIRQNEEKALAKKKSKDK